MPLSSAFQPETAPFTSQLLWLSPGLALASLLPQLQATTSAIAAQSMAHSDLIIPPTSGMWLKVYWWWELKTIFIGFSAGCSQQTLTFRLGLPGLSGILPHQLILLTTRWGSVDSSAPLFTQVSNTYSHRLNDTTLKTIIDCQPCVSWCQVHLRKFLWLNSQ